MSGGSRSAGGRRPIFLLSPARCSGKRTDLLLSDRASFDLAVRLREGAPLGEVFSFMSGLYFRGKLEYALRFARSRGEDVLVIAPGRGLIPPGTLVTRDDLLAFARVEVDRANPAFRDPLARDAALLARAERSGQAVLLGSIATGKYVDVLLESFGPRLCFPSAFVGRGDMSRGGLLLRCCDGRKELDYVPVIGAVRHGPRPPRLEKRVPVA